MLECANAPLHSIRQLCNKVQCGNTSIFIIIVCKIYPNSHQRICGNYGDEIVHQVSGVPLRSICQTHTHKCYIVSIVFFGAIANKHVAFVRAHRALSHKYFSLAGRRVFCFITFCVYAVVIIAEWHLPFCLPVPHSVHSQAPLNMLEMNHIAQTRHVCLRDCLPACQSVNHPDPESASNKILIKI